MDFSDQLSSIGQMVGMPPAPMDMGGDDPKGKKPAPKPFDWVGEMKAGAKKILPYDNQPVTRVVAQAAKEGKIDPSELYSSAWVEGLNEAVINPGKASTAFDNARQGYLEYPGIKPRTAQAPLNTKDFPVDGFYNYGLDTFGDNYAALKKYLPAGFSNKFQLYKAYNDSTKKDPQTGKMVDDPHMVNTAAFKSNKDALVAKAAMMNMEKDKASHYAKIKYGIDLDEKAKKYFTMAAFNSGSGGAQKMIDEYATAPDKNKFIDEGQSQYLGGKVHRNIAPRMKMLPAAQELLMADNAPQPNPLSVTR